MSNGSVYSYASQSHVPHPVRFLTGADSNPESEQDAVRELLESLDLPLDTPVSLVRSGDPVPVPDPGITEVVIFQSLVLSYCHNVLPVTVSQSCLRDMHAMLAFTTVDFYGNSDQRHLVF